MNKKLLAIAVGAAMVAGSAATMAAPTVYGKIDMSIDSLDNGGSGAVASGAEDNDGIHVSSNSSRLGVKGSEDVGGGLSVIYKYEMSADFGKSGLAGNRNAYMGLKGGFGTVLAGRHDTPYKSIGRKVDLFGESIGDFRSLTNGGKHDARLDDAILYKNSFGAVGIALMYVSEDGEKDTGATSYSISFKQGPLSLAAAGQTLENARAGGAEDATSMRINGSYNMGAIKINAMFQEDTDSGGTDGNDTEIMGLGAAFKSGANTFKFQYAVSDGDADDSEATLIALGVDHKLSKSTKVYAVYATMDNDVNTSNKLGGGHDSDVPAGVADESYDGISVGMVHKF